MHFYTLLAIGFILCTNCTVAQFDLYYCYLKLDFTLLHNKFIYFSTTIYISFLSKKKTIKMQLFLHLWMRIRYRHWNDRTFNWNKRYFKLLHRRYFASSHMPIRVVHWINNNSKRTCIRIIHMANEHTYKFITFMCIEQRKKQKQLVNIGEKKKAADISLDLFAYYIDCIFQWATIDMLYANSLISIDFNEKKFFFFFFFKKTKET